MITKGQKLTLDLIKSKKPCTEGWEKLLQSLNKTKSDKTIVSISHLLKSNGIGDTLWVIFNCFDNSFLQEKLNLLYDIGMMSIKYYKAVYPDDNRLEEALKIACDIKSTNKERNAARDVAGQAAGAAARDAARDAAWAARDAAWAARDAAWAARDAARAGAAARDAARDAALDAAGWAAWAAWAAAPGTLGPTPEFQKDLILKHFGDL